MSRTLEMLKQEGDTGREVPEKVFRPRPRPDAVTVHKEGDTFVLTAPGLDRIMIRGDADSAKVRSQLNRQLARLRLDRALKKAGAVPGDRIRCGELEWEL